MMAETQSFLAFDLGAESGRGVLGRFDGEKIALEELHRFPNGGVRVLDSLHWDVLGLWSEMKNALSLCARRKEELKGLGVDTWGVDFALIGVDDSLLGLPYHYRDLRTDGMLEKAFDRLSRGKDFRAQRRAVYADKYALSVVLHGYVQIAAAESRRHTLDVT